MPASTLLQESVCGAMNGAGEWANIQGTRNECTEMSSHTVPEGFYRPYKDLIRTLQDHPKTTPKHPKTTPEPH